MLRIALTGGLGMGKSTAAALLRERGVPAADSDVIAREVVEPGEPALEEILARFGPEVLGPEGRLRRDRLAERVFSDERDRKDLESILHPRIRQRWGGLLGQWSAAGQSRGAVAVPLLYEVNLAGEFDRVVCLACSPATQLERLAARGWGEAQVRSRLAAQWPIEKKMALADFVAWSEGGLEVLAMQLDRILRVC